jgi:hypothetical protein
MTSVVSNIFIEYFIITRGGQIFYFRSKYLVKLKIFYFDYLFQTAKNRLFYLQYLFSTPSVLFYLSYYLFSRMLIFLF